MRANHEQNVFSEGLIDFQAIYHLIREKAWLISLCVVVAGLLGAGYIAKSHNIYAAQTVVQVDQAQRKIVNIQDVNSEDLGSLELLKTIEQNLASGALFQDLIDNLKLDAAALGLPPPPPPPNTHKCLIRGRARSVSVKLLRGTRLITVTAESESPEMAQKISLGLVNGYIHRNIEQRLGISQEANTFLTAEAARLKEKLQKSEQALQDYKEKTQAVSLQETQNITVEKLKELNAKVTGAKSERLKLESDFAQVQKLKNAKPEELLGLQTVAESKAVLDQKRVVAEQEGVVASLSKRYGPLHPKLIQAQSQLKEQKAGLERVIVRTAESIGAAYEAAKETEAKFEQALRDQEQKSLELSKLAIPYNVLQREVESDRALYESVLNRMKETDVTKSLQQDNILIKEPARVPDKPVRPRRVLILAGAILAGLLLGLVVTFGLRALDTSLKTVDEAERELGMPAIGAVPKSDKPISIEEGLLIVNEPNSSVAEAFRTLRASLSLLGKASERKTFLFTSAVPGEGKSFCSINYAVALAQQGLRTLLVDSDLRLPTIGKIFFKGRPHAGVADVIAGQSELHQSIQSTDIENLFILTAGNRAPNPAELLADSGFGDLIKEAKVKFDRVVVDSAPVNAVADSLLLVKHIDSVCLVVHSGVTPKKAVLRAAHKLGEAGVKPAGFILNRLPSRQSGYYYYYSPGKYGDGVYGSSEVVKAQREEPSLVASKLKRAS
jgi:succinoglycan biosynthesis transport protein ExoP